MNKALRQVSVPANVKLQLKPAIPKIVDQLLNGSYAPSSVRKHTQCIKDKQRTLFQPSAKDKLVQKAIALLLSEQFESEFLDLSFAYRPNRNAHKALHAATGALQSGEFKFAQRVDIKDCFEKINLGKMRRMLNARFHDKHLLNLIMRFLEAKVIDEECRMDHGLKQGITLSPVLANLYLHVVLDQFIEAMAYNMLSIKALRFADDLLILSKNREEALSFSKAVELRIQSYGLQFNKSKGFEPTGIITAFQKDCEIQFLGFSLEVTQQGGDVKYNWITSDTSLEWMIQDTLKKIENKPSRKEEIINGRVGYLNMPSNEEAVKIFIASTKGASLITSNNNSAVHLPTLPSALHAH